MDACVPKYVFLLAHYMYIYFVRGKGKRFLSTLRVLGIASASHLLVFEKKNECLQSVYFWETDAVKTFWWDLHPITPLRESVGNPLEIHVYGMR